MNARTSIVQVAGKKVNLEELTVDQVEAVAVEFSQAQMGKGHARRFNNTVLQLAVVEIDDAPATDVRAAFPLAQHWRILDAAYQRLTGEPSLPERNADSPFIVVKVSTGALVTLRPLTADEDEALEIKNRYTAKDWFRAGSDRAAVCIAAIDGKAVNKETFDPRVEFPAHGDWNLFRAAYVALNEVQNVEDFLPGIPASPATTAK